MERQALQETPDSAQLSRPGQCVSIVHMVSSTPGLMGLLRGTTKHWYNSACIFVDQYSGLSYVHLQQSISGDETVEAKQAFEAYSAHLGVTIQHYHADNGIFADTTWRKAI